MKSVLLLLLGLVAVLAACSSGGDENLGLSSRPVVAEGAIDLARLGQPGALEAVLGAPAATVDRRLGAHTRTQSLQLALASGESTEVFDESWRGELDAQGHVHLQHETSRDQGMEYIAVGGDLYVRQRHGRFVKREAQGDEVERLREEHDGVLRGELAALGRFATRQQSATTFAGRPAVAVRLSLHPQAPPYSDDRQAGHAWRSSLRVQSLDGELVLDAVSGALVGGKLDVAYTCERKGKSVTVGLAYRTETKLGGVASIAPPADAVPSLLRPRPLVDRNQLLEGLVPGLERRE